MEKHFEINAENKENIGRICKDESISVTLRELTLSVSPVSGKVSYLWLDFVNFCGFY